MATIGDLYFTFRGDDSQLPADAEKAGGRAGDAAGRTMGQRLGVGLKRGAGAALAGLGATVAVAFGFGTKGLIELDNAMASFQAETGATGAEAEAAGRKILELSKSNLQPMSEIGDTMAQLRTQMGLTQAEAETLTQPFLDFARVTGQTGPAAVNAFDDILDSWNLTAAESKGLMDQLIVSHQKFGGNVAENEATLAALAPAMQAANFSIEDGIGLLNLFGAKGLDANTAAAAFSKALTKVKSPEELSALMSQITRTPDAFTRAQMAADLFGAKAGAKLANALKPTDAELVAIRKEADTAGVTFKRMGLNVADSEAKFTSLRAAGVPVKAAMQLVEGSLRGVASTKLDALTEEMRKAKTPADALKIAQQALGKAGGTQLANALKAGQAQLAKGKGAFDDYRVSTDAAAGATKKAADEQNASFGKQAQLWIKNIQGMATGLVQGLGPGIGGVATAATVAVPALGSLGRGLLGLGKSLGPSLVAGLLGMGPMIGGAGAAIGGFFTTAASLVIAAWPLVLLALVVGAIALLLTNPGIRDTALKVGGAIVGFIGQALGAIVGFLGNVVGQVVNWGGQILSAIGGFVVNLVALWLSIPGRVVGWIAGLLGQAGQIVGGVLGAAGRLASGVVGFIVGIPGRVVGWIAGLIGGAGRAAAGFLGAIGTLAGNVIGTILSIPGKIVGGLVSGFADLAGKAVSAFIGGLASLPGKAAGLIGDIWHNVTGWLPHFATGALFVPQDMLAVVHRGEMIIPAAEAEAVRQGRQGMVSVAPAAAGAGPTTVVNVYNPKPEPASTSVRRELQKRMVLGTV